MVSMRLIIFPASLYVGSMTETSPMLCGDNFVDYIAHILHLLPGERKAGRQVKSGSGNGSTHRALFPPVLLRDGLGGEGDEEGARVNSSFLQPLAELVAREA